MGGFYLEQLRRKRAEREQRLAAEAGAGGDEQAYDDAQVASLANQLAGPIGTSAFSSTLSPSLQAAMRRRASGEADPEATPGPLRTAWNAIASPLKAASGITGSSLVHLLGLHSIFPGAYQRAQRELASGITRGVDRPLTTMEQAEALPGLGDITAQAIPEDTVAERILKPVARLGLNIAGDPTTYLGGAGLATRIPKLARAGTLLNVAEGVAYAPEMLESVQAGAGRTVEEVRAGRYGDAAASATGTMLTAGLGALVAKGVMSEARAAGVLERWAAERSGEKTVPPPGPREAAERAAERAAEQQPEAVMPPEQVAENRPVAEPVPTPPPTPEAGMGVPPEATLAPPAPTPQPTEIESPALNVPTPIPGSERIQVTRGEAIVKQLQDLVEKRSAESAHLTKRDLVEAGLVSRKQAKDYGLEALLDALGGTEMRARLEHVPGLGYRIKTGAEEGAKTPGAVAPEPAEVAPVVEAPPVPAAGGVAVGETAGPSSTTAPGEPSVTRAAQEVSPATFIEGSGLADRIVGLYQQGLSYRQIAEQLTEHEPLVARAAEAFNAAKGKGRSWQKATDRDSPAPYIERAAQMVVHARGLSRTGLAARTSEELETEMASLRDTAALDKRLGTEKVDKAKLDAIERELARRRRSNEEPPEPHAALTFKSPEGERVENAGISPWRVMQTLYPERYGLKEEKRPVIEPIRDRAGLDRAVEALSQINMVRDRIPAGHPLLGMATELEDAIEGATRRGFEKPKYAPEPREEPVPPRPPQPPIEASGSALVRWIKESGAESGRFFQQAERVLGKPAERATAGELNLLLTMAEKNPQRFGAPKPKLEPGVTEQAVKRLMGGPGGSLTEHLAEAPTGEFRFHPSSPAGRAQEHARIIESRFGLPAEQSLQDTMMKWISGLSQDDTRYLRQGEALIDAVMERRNAQIAELERAGKTEEAGVLREETAAEIQKISKRAGIRYDSAQNIRRLLLGETDDQKARAELERLLKRDITNEGKNYAAGEGKRLRPVEDMVLRAADEGLTAEEKGRLAVQPEVEEVSVELPKNYELDVPERPAGVDPDAWLKRVQTEPDLLTRYQNSLAYLTKQWEAGRGKKTGRAGQPWMAPLRQMAADFGVKNTKLGAEDLIGTIGRKLRAETPHAASDLLTEALVKERGGVWRDRIKLGQKIGDTETVVADLERDAGGLVRPLVVHAAPLADALSKATADVANTLDMSGRFRGLIPSPQLNGIRLSEDVLLNPLWSLHQAETRIAGSSHTGLARRDAIAHLAAEDLTDTMIHEIAHARARHDEATGDRSFISSYSQAMQDLGAMRGEIVRSVRDGIEPALDGLMDALPEYRRLLDAERARRGVGAGGGERTVGAEGGNAGAGEGGAQTVANRPGGGEGGAAGGEGARPRPIRPIPPGGGREGARAGGAAAAVEGAAGESAGRGTGAAEPEPHAALTDLLPEGVAKRRIQDTQETIERAFAHNAARYAGRPDDAAEILRRVEAVRALPEEQFDQLLHARPGGRTDIGYNLNKLADVSDEQKAELALALALRNSEYPRSKPMRWENVDAEARSLLNVYTPEEFVKRAKESGLKTEADFALLRTVAATFGREVDEAMSSLRAATIRGDKAAVEKEMDRLAFAGMRRLAALDTLIPETTRVARILAFQRMMIHPLTPEETFKARFMGAMRTAKVQDEKAAQLYSMLQDVMAEGPAGDWMRFTNAFRDATKVKGFDKFLEFWKAGLLGWPTQIANVSTNLLFRGLRDSEHAVSVLGDKFFSAVTGAPRKKFVGEIGARMLGARHGYAEAFSTLKDDLLDIARLRTPSLERRVQAGTFLDEPDVRQLYGAIGGKSGEFVRIPFKLLDAFDNFFKHVSKQQEYGAQANRIAHQPYIEGRQPGRLPNESVQHATSRIFGEIRMAAQNPISANRLFKKYKSAIEAGRNAANIDTYQKALPEAVRKIQQASMAHPATGFFVPFWKTPYNILTEGIKRTPPAALYAIHQFRKGKIDDAAFVERMVQSALGTSLMAIVSEAALNGTITGGGPTDPKETELLKRTGWQPRSIKIGDDYYSYQRLAPFSIVLGMAADIGEAWKRKDIDTASELMQKGVASISDNIFDQTFVSGLDSMMKILTNPQKEGLSALRAMQASLVPNVVGVIPFAHAARAIDPNYRETEAFTLSPFEAQIPFASTALQPQRTPTGEIRERPGSPLERMLSPISRSTAKTGPIPEAAAEIARLGVGLSAPGPYFRVGADRVYYTPEEREQIAAAQTKAMEKVASIISRSDYQRLPDNEMVATAGQTTKRDAIMKIVSAFRRPVVERMNRQALMREKGAQSERASR